MSYKLALIFGAFLTPLIAQQAAPAPKPPPPPPPPAATASRPAEPAKPTGPQGTISGIVVQKGSKNPIEGAQMTLVGANAAQFGARSDAEGKFTVRVPPGGYQITTRLIGQSGFIGVPTVKVVNVRQDEEAKTEIEMPKAAEISGRVLDARGEPVQGARVTLLLRNYEVWSTNIIYMNTPFGAQTNDLGEYFFEGVPTGIAFYAFAEMVTPGTAEALATTAADPDARRPILAGTFYPQSMDPGGAQPLTLSEGEVRERVDIRMAQTKSYCVEDVLVPAIQSDAPHTINVDLNAIINGVFNGYGAFRSGRIVSLDKNGRARVCGLWPGHYRFSVQPQNRGRQPQSEFYGFGEFIVTDKDLTTIPARIGPIFDWEGEVVIDGAAPATPITQPIMVGFTNITPTSLATRVQTTIPGKFTLKNLHFDRELLSFAGLPDGWYVKSAKWGNAELTDKGGRFILDKVDEPLRISVSPDGSRFRIKVADDRGEPAVGVRVNMAPGNISSAQQLTARLWSCYSDTKGECSVFALPNETPRTVFAPGQYWVLAAEIPYNQGADVLDQIWRTLQTVGTKVTLSPGSTGEATIKEVVLR